MPEQSYVGIVTKTSGTSRDQEVTGWIKTLIQKGHIPVKTLDDMLLPGMSISAMEHDLVQNARCVFVVVSNDFLTTPGTHQKQLKHAMRAHECMPSGRIFLVPILADQCYDQYQKHRQLDPIKPVDVANATTQEEFEAAFFAAFGFDRGRETLAISHQ